MLKPIKHTRYEYIDEFGFYYVISDIINFPDKRYMVERYIQDENNKHQYNIIQRTVIRILNGIENIIEHKIYYENLI